MMPIEEAGKDTWNPSSPSGNNLPWALLQPWISAGGNNRDPRYPAGQQLPGGAWQDVDGYYGGGRRGGASTGESSTTVDRVVDAVAQLYCLDGLHLADTLMPVVLWWCRPVRARLHALGLLRRAHGRVVSLCCSCHTCT